ncbi:MAG TPA: Holliday junction resolvase RuvX [Chlamydiales bacterium]|nr:Holliday junction resolvase RuvX [Chlamydiales bacterium]
MPRILAIDLGKARIGLAISDELKIFASSLHNIEADRSMNKTVQLILAAIHTLEKEKRCTIEEIVLGLPLKMDGTDSPTTTHVRAFYEALKAAVAITVTLFDERLTTLQAERSLKEANFTRKKRAQFVDGVSAVILLQSYLSMKGSSL